MATIIPAPTAPLEPPSDPASTIAPPVAAATIPDAIRRRLVNVLFVGQSLFSAGQIVSFGVMPIVAAQLGGSEAMAGLPATVTLVGRALAAFPVGWLMDRLGRRFGLSTGFMLCVIGSIISALAIGWASFIGFLVGVIIAGMGRGIGEQARFAAAEVETHDRRAKAIGLVVFAGTIGAVVGPLLMAPAEQGAIRFGLQSATGPLWVSALLFYLAFMLTVLMLRPDPMLVARTLEANQPKSAQTAGGELRTLGYIFADWNVRLALIAMTVGQLVMTTLMVITPLHMAKISYDTNAIGVVLMAHTIGMFALASVTGWLIDRSSSTLMIGVGSLILLLSAVLLPVSNALWMLSSSLFLLGLGWNFCFVAGSALLSAALQPGERGRVQGASETLISLASGIGSLSVGLLFATGGMFGISLGGFAFAAVLLVATLWIVRIRPQPIAVGGD